MRPIAILICMFAVFSANAQKIIDCPAVQKQGDIKINAPDELAAKIYKSNEISDEPPTLKGFRIQVFAGSDRALAQKTKTDLLTQYPNSAVYLLYEPPYFKVRVGDYHDRIEAQKMLHDLKGSYTSVLLVPDKINFPDLR